MIIQKLSFFFMAIFALSVSAAEEKLVPDHIIQGFLKDYSDNEKDLIEKDYKNIRDFCFHGVQQKQRLYLGTAGGPGASKSTILETYLKDYPGFVYVDPDQQALKFMMYTYRSSLNNYEISKSPSYADLLEKAYKKWRGGSNYISNTILNEAIENGLPVAHGTTSTSKSMKEFYEKLKKKGYTIKLLLCMSPDDNRYKSIEERARTQCFVQSTLEDVIQKGNMFYDNFPIYFEYADEIILYWIDDYKKGWIEIAKYSKEKGLDVRHQSIEKARLAYETYRNKKNTSLPSFETLVQLKK